MILKKPYALLIKNFRTIHIILTLLAVFITTKTHTIVKFFRDFIINNYSVTVTDNLVSSTISNWLYIAIIAAIIILISVYVLLHSKKKPNKVYLITIIYYIILFIFIIVASSLISSLSDSLWQTADARTYRDFAQLIYYPNYIFLIILGIRALGFNVKQFKFKDDLKELEITEKDSEEIELNINFQTYKAERKVRRFIREFKYYFIENKLIFIVIGIILILVLGFIIFKNSEKLKYTYKENESFNYNGFTINVLDSMMTNIDLNGKSLYNDKYVVLIRFSIKNNTKDDKYLDYSNFKLYYGSNYVYPTLDIGNKFLDYGDPFMNDKIKSGDKRTYIMPYIVDKKNKNSNFKIEIYLGSSNKSDKFLAKTANVKLKPVKYENVEIVREAPLKDKVLLNQTLLGDSTIKIDSIYISNRYEYKYESCYKDECRTYTDVVVADSSYQMSQALLVMDYELILDKESPSYKNINDLQAFASNFIEVEYIINNIVYKASVKYANPAKVKDKLILQTEGLVAGAEKIKLLITIRNRCYVINLK